MCYIIRDIYIKKIGLFLKGALQRAVAVAQEPLDWVEFWRRFRLGDQLQLLRQRNPSDRPRAIPLLLCQLPERKEGMSTGKVGRRPGLEIQEKGAQLMERLPELFAMLDVKVQSLFSVRHNSLKV
jgi:hypothetical protein